MAGRPPDLSGRAPAGAGTGSVLDAVLASLEMSQLADGRYAGPNVVLAGYRRLFGGQLLAQSLAAARASGVSPRTPRSVHLVFCAEGRPESPVAWDLGRVHDGRTFATRSLLAVQDGVVLACGVVSLHQADDPRGQQAAGPVHDVAPPVVEDPVELASAPLIGAMALETRVAGGVELDGSGIGPPELACWMRRPPDESWSGGGRSQGGGDGNVGAVDEALLAYSSDVTMLAAALRPHEGVSYGSPRLKASAVTSQTVSFHRPVSFDDWLLFAQTSPVATGGRAYVRGDWYRRDGKLVASSAQESVLRVVD